MNKPILSHRDLIVFQMSMDVAVIVWGLADSLPQDDQSSLGDQLRRAALSIPSNISEGFGRGSPVDYARLLGYALTSSHELSTQLDFSVRIKRFTAEDVAQPIDFCDQIGRMLNVMIAKLRLRAETPTPHVQRQLRADLERRMPLTRPGPGA